jgi:branched-chain amino acid transport system substrate-binding protein
LGITGKLRTGIAIAAAGAVLSATACTAPGSGDVTAVDTVVIAADLELTGEGSALGTVFRNALELRVDQINEQGLLGERRLQLDIRDNRTDATTSMSNVSNFIEDEAVTAIITGGCAACFNAVAPLIEDGGVPTISLAGPEAVASTDWRYAFKLGPNPTDTAVALAAELSRADVATVALVASDDAYGADGIGALTAAADRAGVDVATTIRISNDEAAMQAAANEVMLYIEEHTPAPTFGPDGLLEQAEALDAVVIWAYSPMAGDFAVHLRDGGFDGALFLDMAAADDLFLGGRRADALAGATIIFTETLVIDQVIATSPAKAARKTWFNDYSARHGTYHAFASFAADAVDIVVQAVNRLDSGDRTAVRGLIERTQFDGLSGPIRLTPDNHSGLTPLALTTLVVRGDRWRPAG